MLHALSRARNAFEIAPTPAATMSLRQTIIAVCRRELRRNTLSAELQADFEALVVAASKESAAKLLLLADRLVEACYQLERDSRARRATRELPTFRLHGS